jgi:hypothetical protein
MAITIGAANQQLDTDDLIRQALDGGVLMRDAARNTWTFPSSGPDGRIGALSVSRYQPAPVAGANQALGVHITFGINGIFVPSLVGIGRVPPAAIRVEVANMHFTVRPENVQLAIGGDNVVARTPAGREVSDHRGTVNN